MDDLRKMALPNHKISRLLKREQGEAASSEETPKNDERDPRYMKKLYIGNLE